MSFAASQVLSLHNLQHDAWTPVAMGTSFGGCPIAWRYRLDKADLQAARESGWVEIRAEPKRHGLVEMQARFTERVERWRVTLGGGQGMLA